MNTLGLGLVQASLTGSKKDQKKQPKISFCKKNFLDKKKIIEDDQNGRQPTWKTTKREDEQNGRRTKWKTNKMQDDQNGCRPKWKSN